MHKFDQSISRFLKNSNFWRDFVIWPNCAAGAMRECFRMKKLSNFSQNQDWARDSNNYVAKSYMDTSVSKEIYFEDVKLQMDAKLWGEEFNRHNPPKVWIL